MSTHSECQATGCSDCRGDGVTAFARRTIEKLNTAKREGWFLLALNEVVIELEVVAKDEFELEE